MPTDPPSVSLSLSLSVWAYAVPALAVWLVYLLRQRQLSARHRAVLAASREAGHRVPDTLHPEVDPMLCIGSGSCVSACPEGDVLGLVGGQAELIDPSRCIGHGACRDACPVDAIRLVLGTPERGVEIPRLTPDFETSVPGLFVAGELAGMGLIRNAIEQGRQAVEAIRRLAGIGAGDPELDLVIVGAGPAGFAASLAAQQHGLRCLTLEQESLGGAVSHYPRGKLVMTSPVELPGVGRVRLRETSKEALLDFWRDVEARSGIEIRYGVRVQAVTPVSGGFEVETKVESGAERLRARAVLLSVGRRGTPRKLDVPGEDSAKVVYRLVDPEQYHGRHVLVVGGGDSALEAACRLAEDSTAEVTLAYRGDAFARARPKNRESVERCAASGRLRLRLSSRVLEILPDAVRLETGDGEETLANDAVIVCVGGVLPSEFLKSMGIEIETCHGKAVA